MSTPDDSRIPLHAEFFDTLVSFYDGEAVSWGAIDLFLVGRAGWITRMGDYAAYFRAVTQDAAPVFREIWLVLPPFSDEPGIFDAIRAHVAEVWARKRGAPLTADELDALSGPVRFVAPESLEVESLLRVLRAVEPNSGVIVGRAALYRSSQVDEPASDLSMPGDTWAPHLRALVEELREPARAAGCFVVLDAGEALPWRPEFRESLRSVENAFVLSVEESPSDKTALVADQRWRTLVSEGRLDEALAELQASEEFSPREKTLVRLHLYSVAGLPHVVRTLLESSRDLLSQLEPEGALRVAAMAESADADDVATELLAGAAGALRSREELEMALKVAGRIGDRELVGTVERELQALFPDSGALRRHRAARLAADRRYREAALLLEGDRTPGAAELAEFWTLLAEHLETPGATDVQAYMDAVAERLPDRLDDARRLGAERLVDERRGEEAFALLLPQDAPQAPIGREQALAVLDLVQRSAMRQVPVSDGVVAHAIERVIEALSLRPMDTSLRFRLLRILSPEVLGLGGVATLAYVTNSLSRRPVRMRERRPRLVLDDSISEEDVVGLLQRGSEWLESRPHSPFGARAMPPELLGMSADRALAVARAAADRLVGEYGGPGDKEPLTRTLAMVAAIAPHSSAPDEDLLVLRHVAGRLAHAGHVQYARDWAENVLALTHGDPFRTRLAWTSFADIYARTGNVQEAMSAIACAVAAHPESTWEDVWYESQLIFRLLRDTGLLEFARPFIETGREALEHLGLEAQFGSRVETAELQLELWEYAHDGIPDVDRLRTFIQRAEGSLRRVLEIGDDPAPATMILASAMRLGESRGVEAPPAAQTLLDTALQRVDPRRMELIRTEAAAAPTVDQVVDLVRRIEPARYSEDIGYDVRHLAPVAERLLGAEGVRDPAAAVYAVELLADQTIPLPGAGSGPGRHERLIDSRDGPARAAREIARENLGVVVMGFADDRAVHVTAGRGVLHPPVIEDEGTFSMQRLSDWSEEYPYGYAGAGEGNVFYTTTEGIGLTALPDRAVVVARTSLQGFPPNLLRIGEDLAGWDRRLAAAPSLTWLLAAWHNPFRGDGRKLSWIPHEGEGDGFQALAMVAGRLRETFADHGVDLSTVASPRTDAAGADLAVVAAHGGVTEANRFFGVVADDADLKLTPASLAASLAGVGTVVLFVCSGGRIDQHPGANAVLGLAKRLLASGCRAVVAPPWPLEVIVPPYWLPTFLAEWESGAAVIDASFAANAAVRARFGSDPARCLAMTVYGDPLVTKTP